MREIVELVRAHRLVTLTGVGGVGKTRLAVEVAADLASEFPYGVWLVELASVADPEAVPERGGQRAGNRPSGWNGCHPQHHPGTVWAPLAYGVGQL